MNKTSILAVIIVTLMAPAWAQDDIPVKTEPKAEKREVVSQESKCKAISDLAETIMRARQTSNVHPHRIIAKAKEYDLLITMSELRVMVRQAYSGPDYATDRYENRAIYRFRDAYWSDCMAKEESDGNAG